MIHTIFTTDEFLEVDIESWPDIDIDIDLDKDIDTDIDIDICIYIHMFIYICIQSLKRLFVKNNLLTHEGALLYLFLFFAIKINHEV